jgi:hypothetical protein
MNKVLSIVIAIALVLFMARFHESIFKTKDWKWLIDYSTCNYNSVFTGSVLNRDD